MKFLILACVLRRLILFAPLPSANQEYFQFDPPDQLTDSLSGSSEIIDIGHPDSNTYNIILDEDEEEFEEVFIIVEEMPVFTGNEEKDFRKYIQENLIYPKEAWEAGIEGRVFVQFIVDKDGQVKNAHIVRGIDPVLDQEALRVINSSPIWQPGKQRGKPVNVQIVYPFSFIIQ